LPCFLVSYELPPGADIALQAAIKSYPGWARITATTWAVVTDVGGTATGVRNYLQEHAGAVARMFVVRSSGEAAWNNVQCNSHWLQQAL